MAGIPDCADVEIVSGNRLFINGTEVLVPQGTEVRVDNLVSDSDICTLTVTIFVRSITTRQA